MTIFYRPLAAITRKLEVDSHNIFKSNSTQEFKHAESVSVCDLPVVLVLPDLVDRPFLNAAFSA